nr:HAD family phosphatase [Candidatus Freyrarchaeum guaymaensis]
MSPLSMGGAATPFPGKHWFWGDGMRTGFIWDIDGVVLDSPHEMAWRETARKPPWNVKSLSTEFYFRYVASKPRLEGADNILRLKGVYERLGAKTEEEKRRILIRFSTEKNEMIRELIRRGEFRLFRDAVLLLLRAKRSGVPQASASASKNAKDMLVRVDRGRILREIGDDLGVVSEHQTLYDVFDVDACGLDLGGKEEIQRYAAEKLREKFPSLKCFVVFEDSPSGVEAAKSLGFFVVGVYRIGSVEELRKAGADIVTGDLEQLSVTSIISEVEKQRVHA